MADPRTPEQLKALLQNQQIPAAARQKALDAALVQLDSAEQAAETQGRSLGTQISQALKQSFTNSITRIYSYALWLVVAALILVVFFLPEKPLRTTNRPEVMPVGE